MLLAELICLSNQAQYHNGAILAGGLVYVYYKGRTALATTYQDANGNVENSNPIVLDNMGRCSVYASPDYSYTLVFCDKYNKEQFSYDKDLLDAVPVEDTYSIGIKGDDTISVNKALSGQTVVYNLHAKGEDYNGIDPIVVNNNTREISAHHKPLGVEYPLTFTQDDEEATIIGFDETVLPGIIEPLAEDIVMSAVSSVSGNFATSSFVIQQTSGKQDKLTPGSYVEITPSNQINVTGVQPAGSYATVNDFVGLSGYINQHEAGWSQDTTYSAGSGIKIENNIITVTGEFGHDYSAGANIDIQNYTISGKDWTNEISNATQAATSGKLDSSAYHNYSAGANVDITNYIVSGKDWSSDIANATSGMVNKLDASAFSSFTATADVTPYSAGNNVTIQNHVISLSGDLGKVYTGSGYVVVDNTNDKIGLTDEVSTKLDDFVGQYNLSAGENTVFRVDGTTVYIDTEAGYTPTYEPIIEDI